MRRLRCTDLVAYIIESQAGDSAVAGDAVLDSLVVKILIQNAGQLYVRVAVLPGRTRSVCINFVTVAFSGIPVLREGTTWSVFGGPRLSGIVAKRYWGRGGAWL
jgi:hypothetical protein